MIYFYIVFILALFSVFESCGLNKISCVKSLKLNKFIYIYISILLVFIVAFRYETGRDWKGYTSYFEKCLYTESSWEYGFVLINKIFKYLFSDFYVMQFFVMIFCCKIVYKSFYDKSEYPIYTMFFYFITLFLNKEMAQTRQFCAMAVLLMGECAIKKRNILLWLGYVFLAMQFHITAIFAFPLYFSTYKTLKNRTVIFLFLFSVLLNYFGLNFVRFCVEYTLQLPFIPSRIAVIGGGYINSTVFGQQVQFSSGLGVLFRYVFYILMFIAYKMVKTDKEKYFIFNFLIAIIFQAMGRNFDVLTRIAHYYLVCGGGLCAYNLLIDSKAFFKRLSFLRIFVISIFLLFNIWGFYQDWTRIGADGASVKADYSPYKSVLFNRL